MTTRNIVPRATGEGSLGTNAKKWGDVYANNVHGSLDGNATSATKATNDEEDNNIASTYAPKDSPTFTGTPTALTQATNDNSTKLATTGYVVNDLKANAFLASNTFTTTLQTGVDLNTITTPGTYTFSNINIVNGPSITVNYGKLFVSNIQSTSSVLQVLISNGGIIFKRRLASTSWDNWKRLAYAEDVLPLTGGTMTGTLELRTTQTSGIKTITLHNDAYGYGIFSVRNDDVTKGNAPTTTKGANFLQSWDSNSAFIGGVYFSIATNNSSRVGLSINWHSSTRMVYIESYTENEVYFYTNNDNITNLGKASARWKQLYAGTTTIATSDERLKDNIESVPDEVLDAWGEVGWYQYQFKDSIEEKGENARLHTGAIAQRIESIFSSHGLDANRYGLLCYDSWKAEPEERDEQGNIVQPARPAGNRYSLRYEEALCMEAAYQRRRADRLEERIARLESLINNIEK